MKPLPSMASNIFESARFKWGKALRSLLAVALIVSPVFAANAKDEPTTIAAKAVNAPLLVDEAWGGTGVSYDAVSSGTIVYIAYYDADRFFSIARVDMATGRIQKKRLESRFVGWDAHNSVTLELDHDGLLHVTGNMHAAPLVYARMLKPGDFGSLTQINRMIGSDESAVTYPRFFRFPDESLAFTYRSGRSGDGVEFINKFDGERWTRVVAKPLFSGSPGGEHVNAYHTDYVRGPDARFHVAWVWRQTSQAETNFNVMYARSPDLVHWEDSAGRQLTLPLTPANAELVSEIPPRGGLFNNVKLGFDAMGAPVISYLRYDDRGNSQVYHARRLGSGWQIAQSTDWKYRWAFSGGGTLVLEIAFSGVRLVDGVLIEDVTHREHGRKRLRLDPDTLAGSANTDAAVSVAPIQNVVRTQPPFRAGTRDIRPASAGSVSGIIRWSTLGSTNNDRPRSCASVGMEPDCRMVGPIELLIQ